MTEYLLTIPDDVFRRARRVAEQLAQPVDEVMIEHLRTLPSALPAVSPEEEVELEALRHLSDDALWTIAREQMGVEQQERLQVLMDNHSLGQLPGDEVKELEQLVERSQRLILRKSEAAALLAQRGYLVDHQNLAPRD